jgi:hypothetical protein
MFSFKPPVPLVVDEIFKNIPAQVVRTDLIIERLQIHQHISEQGKDETTSENTVKNQTTVNNSDHHKQCQ